MISMAAASVVLPFLPLTAGQILLNNLLSDIPAVRLAGDRVDPELVERPQRWHMAFIGRLLITTFAVIAAALALPYLPFSVFFGLEPLPFRFVVAVVVITLLYVLATDVLKLWFFRDAARGPRTAEAWTT